MKVNCPFLYSSMKRNRKDSADFENDFENPNFATFDLQYQIKSNTYLEPLFGHFHRLCLLTTKLSYIQLFK